MQIIDFEALRQRAEMRGRPRFTVLPSGGGGPDDIVNLPTALRRWASEQVAALIPEPDPGPSAA